MMIHLRLSEQRLLRLRGLVLVVAGDAMPDH
jgi:hypothetical protein